jgi:hypothetical protein
MRRVVPRFVLFLLFLCVVVGVKTPHSLRQMSLASLAYSFGPNLLGPPPGVVDLQIAMQMSKNSNAIVQTMLECYGIASTPVRFFFFFFFFFFFANASMLTD